MTITMSITTLASPTTAINAADVTGPDNQLITHLNNLANGAQAVEALRFQEITVPSTPPSTMWKLYFKTDGLYVVDDAGAETGPLAEASVSSGDTFNMVRNQMFS